MTNKLYFISNRRLKLNSTLLPPFILYSINFVALNNLILQIYKYVNDSRKNNND